MIWNYIDRKAKLRSSILNLFIDGKANVKKKKTLKRQKYLRDFLQVCLLNSCVVFGS